MTRGTAHVAHLEGKVCEKCARPIRRGELIRQGSRGWEHAWCPDE